MSASTTIRVHESEVSISPDAGPGMFAIVDSATTGVPDASYLPECRSLARIVPSPGHEPDGLPWLVRLEPEHEEWLRERSLHDDWGIVVKSSLDLPTLAAGLGARLNALQGNGEPLTLRYFDPRVLEPILRSFSVLDAARWFTGVEAFGVLRPGRIRWLSASPSVRLVPCDTGALSAPLRLTDGHLEPFRENADTALTDEVTAFLEHERPGSFSGIPPVIAIQMVRAAITRALGHGFLHVADIAAFAAIMLDVAPNFDEQPDIQSCLALPLTPASMRLRAAIEMCPDEAWEQAERDGDPGAWFVETETSR